LTTKLIPLLALCVFGACAPSAWGQAGTAAPAPAATGATAPASPAAVTDDKAAAGASADAAATAPAAPTEPQLVGTDKISAGDTAWMLTSTALVLMMTIPGLALFYAGMVRKKNILATVMQSFAITCLVTLLWWVVGYSWAFTPGSSAYLGGTSRFLLHGLTFMKDANKLTVSHLALTIPESVYAMFQLTFAIITPALIAGAFADRMKFSAMLAFMTLWSLIVYVPVAHWVWEPSGWLAARGVLDYAGGTVVHINAGIAGLASCLVLGKRLGYGKDPMPPYNLTLTMIGASLLWVGWFGFNAGSAGAADGRAGMAMMATQIATAAAAMSWMFVEWFAKGKPSVLGIASGAVAGLVAITPASGFVGPSSSVVIGIAAGVICFFAATTLKRAVGYDDSLDAFGVHCVGGIVGALLTGVLASKEIAGVEGSFMTQLLGVGTTLIYGFVMSFIILKLIDMTIGLRVTEDQEREGLDISLHGESIE
jgi:ammonium transporter, Amt family